MRSCGALFLMLILAFFARAEDLPVFDADFSCITTEKANQYVQDFAIDAESFGGMELCDSKVDTKKLFNDLRMLEEGRFVESGSNHLIRGFLRADNYYQWMRGQTFGIERGQTFGIERGQDVPYATAYNRGGYFTMQDGWAQLSTLGRIGTVVHEARHTEGYMHIACNQGPYYGTGVAGCDRDYSYGGSHAIEMEYYARVAVMGQNFHPIFKKMARLMAMGRSNFVFNTTPLRQAETLMMLGTSGRAYIWTQNQWIEREAPRVKATLKRTSFGASLFDGLHAFALDPYANANFATPVTDEYSYFKLLLADRGLGHSPLQDLEEVDAGRKRYIVAMTTGHQLVNFNFRGGAWGSPGPAPSGAWRFATWAPSGQNGLFVLDESRRVYAFDPERMTTTLTSEAWEPHTKTYLKAGPGFFRLDDEGHLTQVRGGGEERIETPEAVDQIVAIPLFDAFEVQP